MKFFNSALAAGIVAFSASAATAATVMIDDFNAQQYVEDVPRATETNISTLATATVLGGSRTMSVSTSPNNGTNPIAGSTLESTGAAGFPAPSVLKFANDTFQRGLATVVYGLAAGGVALGDLTDGGLNDKFFFEVVSGDLPGTVYTATVEDTLANSHTVTELLVPGFSPFQAFSDFVGVDLSSVASLTFTLDSNGVEAFDGAIGSVSAVPVPAAGLLLLGGLGGLAAVGRRRRRKS
ncbi:VPLPA-CTERM sorting domain-containing protein [Sulfitobacter sp. F26169L]|uniref:VPLPA-CTERM sorting domain-containing protein n=1 Tax=Sulfitobacter sp. F26169L TaxID=2996015 RepID=UPI002260C235|nr:VPLPA-CTERM sorting domain-containing protein [Sulfitobacter sp. F26169L]MCX7567498.1 VPLPA-CTERM sorting domain-containing protein [Sulfitobacter sp. F26169L]